MLQRFRRPFYGWWIVGAAIVLQALPSGLLQQAYGAYVVLRRGKKTYHVIEVRG